MRNSLCLLCYRVRERWCIFLNQFKSYNIFIIVDCNFQPLIELKNKYKNIKFIKIDDLKCINSGYYNSVNELWKRSEYKVISWDKALYYFSRIFKNYENVWLLEDDVFFYNENTIINIDNKNKKADLIIKKFNPENNKFDINDWHWKKLIKFENDNWKNLATHTMVCCIRLSKKYLNYLSNYVCKHKKLCLIESLIPTLAIVHKLNIKYEENLKITYREKFKYINRSSIYHPIKNLNIQYDLREKLKYNNSINIFDEK